MTKTIPSRYYVMKVYELFLNDELKDGINCISVVEDPAMESQFIALKKQNHVFAKVDEKKKILMGVIMKPNKKIFRLDEETQEKFEVFFSADTVRRASELYFKNNKQTNFNVEHNSEDVLQAYLVESWIVEDTQKDKSAVYNLGADVGDWVGTMKFDNEEEYNKALESGTGFSLEGIFSEKIILNKVSMDFKQMKDELLNDLKGMFSKQVKLAQAKLQDGTGAIEFDGDMPMVGAAISLVTADGNVPAPVGEYTLEDGTVVTVTDVGMISEISTAAEDAADATEPAAMASPTTSLDETGQLKDMISSILVKFGEDMEAKFTKQLDAKFSQTEKEVTALKVELGAEPAVSKTRVAPVEQAAKVSVTQKGRLLDGLNNLKNK